MWLSTCWWWLVAGLAVLVLVLAMTERGPAVGGGEASYSNTPYCRTAQLHLTLGPNVVLAGGRVVTSLLSLTNNGATCELAGDTPLLQPVAGTRHTPVGRGDVSDNALRPPVIVSTGETATSQVSVESLPAKFFRTCRARRVTGVVVIVGLPKGTNRYVAHVFPGVCANPLRNNVGAAWYVAPRG